MPKSDLRPWVPNKMVVEVLSTRAAAPWEPWTPYWREIAREATVAIFAARSSSWSAMRELRRKNG